MALAKIQAAKLRLLKRPCHMDGTPLDPKLPLNLSDLESAELGRLFGEFAIMAQYAIQVRAISDVSTAARKRIDVYTRARTRLQKSGTVQDKDAKTEIDSRVRESSLKLLVNESTTVLTDALLQSYIIGKDVLSREMTRRQFEGGRQL